MLDSNRIISHTGGKKFKVSFHTFAMVVPLYKLTGYTGRKDKRSSAQCCSDAATRQGVLQQPRT